MTPCTTTEGVSLPITPLLRDLATVFARQRMADHLDRPVEHDRGDEQANFQADFYGCLAELTVTLEIQARRIRMGLPCEDGFLRKGATDLRLGDRLLEIKAIPPGKRYVCLNAAQYERTDPATWYLPCAFTADGKALRILRPVAFATIANQWDYRTDRHAPYFSTDIRHLPALSSLDALCRAA